MTQPDTSTSEDAASQIVKIRINSVLEIPLAYEKAIIEFRKDDEDWGEDIWDAKIELKQINFEKNFRRSNYECVFVITIGNFLYAK